MDIIFKIIIKKLILFLLVLNINFNKITIYIPSIHDKIIILF